MNATSTPVIFHFLWLAAAFLMSGAAAFASASVSNRSSIRSC